MNTMLLEKEQEVDEFEFARRINDTGDKIVYQLKSEYPHIFRSMSFPTETNINFILDNLAGTYSKDKELLFVFDFFCNRWKISY